MAHRRGSPSRAKADGGSEQSTAALHVDDTRSYDRTRHMVGAVSQCEWHRHVQWSSVGATRASHSDLYAIRGIVGALHDPERWALLAS